MWVLSPVFPATMAWQVSGSHHYDRSRCKNFAMIRVCGRKGRKEVATGLEHWPSIDSAGTAESTESQPTLTAPYVWAFRASPLGL